MTKLQPIGSRLVLKTTENIKKSAGGIYIPDNAQEKKNIAEVIAVGEKIESGIKVGDKVIYSKFAPTEVEIDGEKLLITDEKDILAIIK